MAEIIKTRIIPKKLVDPIISRERLINLINNNLSRSIFLVIGPAGIGKTTLVLDYLAHANKKYAWLNLAPDVNSFGSFIHYLVYSLRVLDPNFGNKTFELLDSMTQSRMLASDETDSINSIMGTFVNEFVECFKDDTSLVIDDLHNAGTKTWVESAFNYLVENFPPNLNMFITSRSFPEFSYSRLAAKRSMLKIDSSALNFDLQETQKLLNDIYSVECSKKELELLEKRLEGWITGIHLILQAYGSNFASAIVNEDKIDENIFLFFAEEVFNSLDEPTREFLIITCMVDSFTEEMCKFVQAGNDAVSILRDLRKKNLFLESSVDESAQTSMKYSYSYHNLFKQFLQAKLHELKPQSEIEKIAERVFEFYISKNDTVNAIEYSLYAGNYFRAAELIIQSFEKLFTEGLFEQLDRWITAFPPDKLDKFPRLKYYKGLVAKQFKVDLDTALSLFTGISGSEEKGSELYVLANSEIAEIYLVKGRPADSVKSLTELLGLSSVVNLKIKVSISLSKAYYRMGSRYYDDIIRVLDETIILCDQNNIREYHPEIYSLYGRVYQNKGDFSKSLHYFKNVVQLEKNVFRKFQVITDIVLLHSWSGEYLKAKEYLNEAEEIYEKFHARAFKRSMLRTTALFKFEIGDYEDAIATLTELNVTDIKNNIYSYSFLYNLFICESYILLNMQEKAKEFLGLAKKSRESGEEFRGLLIDYHEAIIKNLGEPDQSVEKAFLAALKYFSENELVYSKTQVEFHIADYYYKTGKLQTCLKYLKDSLDTSSQKQFCSFLVQNFVMKRYLFDFASANRLHSGFLQSIHEILAERLNFNWLSAECMKRMKNESISLFDIVLNTFGGVELYVRGVPVEEDRWIRKKSKLLLIYLLIYREQKHTKDKILELFFGDLSAASAENVFHQAVTNIRNIVRPYEDKHGAKEKKSAKESHGAATDSFIQYQDRILKIAHGYNYKVDITEFTRISNLMRSPETEESKRELYAEQAIEIYKGEFLPGYYDDWIEDIRMNMQNRFINICEELIKHLHKKSGFEELINYGEKLTKEDKLHVEGFISLIEAYSKAGNSNMAKKKFSQLLKNYEEEYGEKPEKDVLDRIGKILNSG